MWPKNSQRKTYIVYYQYCTGYLTFGLKQLNLPEDFEITKDAKFGLKSKN